MHKKNILHITAHMGGGVGKVLSGVSAYASQRETRYCHSVLLLEKPEKTNFIDVCHANHVGVHVAENEEDILDAINESDVVQVEWWHHPLMCAWLAKFPPIPVRLVMWSHVSGCFYPYIPPALLKIPQKFIFTSRYSLDNAYWDEPTKHWASNFCSVINSSGGFDNIGPRKDDGHSGKFAVGYLGTQSYSKIHPDFIKFCQKVRDIPGIEFQMIGDRTNVRSLTETARACGIEDKFHFIGYVSDVESEFSRMDVFGYLLNPTHFGTTENALLEAMASELPVVCLNQCAEKYLVHHGETGFLINSMEEYGQVLRFLFFHPEECKRIGKNARKYVLENFSVKSTVDALHGIYDEVLFYKKKIVNFSNVFGECPHEFFLSCLPPILKENFTVTSFLPPILKEESKSSIYHFARTYPDDEILQSWKRKLQLFGV